MKESRDKGSEEDRKWDYSRLFHPSIYCPILFSTFLVLYFLSFHQSSPLDALLLKSCQAYSMTCYGSCNRQVTATITRILTKLYTATQAAL